MESLLKKYADKTAVSFAKNPLLDELISTLKSHLQPIQRKIEAQLVAPQWPVLGILGNSRCGSTVFLQWLSSLGCFSYPTNVLARFAYAPAIGAMVQNMLFDPKYDYHGNFSDIQSVQNYTSDLGRSRGALVANEFYHFFRNYLPSYDIQYLDDKELSQSNVKGLISGLASIEAELNMPFIVKAKMLQYNLDYFDPKMPFWVYVHIRRDPFFTMQSLLQGRERYYGDRILWWAAKPKEYEWLKDTDVYSQIAGQVYFTNKAILLGLENVSEKRKLIIDYEQFCEKPKGVYDQLVEKYAALGCVLPTEYIGKQKFVASQSERLSQIDADALRSAYMKYDGR
jgi:hypothetical protein